MAKSKKIIFFPKYRNSELYQKYCTDKKYRNSTLILNILIALILPLLVLISSYPYEGHFITFETINDSLAYKNIGTENIDIYEYDDCVFVVDNSEYDIYSVTKVNERYKLADFNSEILSMDNHIKSAIVVRQLRRQENIIKKQIRRFIILV